MEIILAEHRGFCYGVKRAVEKALSVKGSPDVYTLGPLIHNPQVVEYLAQQGIQLAGNLADIAQGTVIIRSHGVEPGIYTEAEDRGLTVIDATCPHVQKAQRSAHSLLLEGYSVVVIGEKHHPEVQAIVGWCAGQAQVVESVEEAKHIQPTHKIGVVSQTTFAVRQFEAIVDVLKTKTDDIKVMNTICTATDVRQQAAVKLAQKVDVMIVIGGRNSANTTHLADLCRQAGAGVHHIETARELTAEMFAAVQKIGITAGASTPDWLIEEVYQKMQEFNEKLEAADELNILETGSVVKGKVAGINKDEVFVDVGYKGEGIILLSELAYPTPENAEDIVSVGQTIDVYVLDADSSEGQIKLSKVRADRIVAWDTFEKALKDQLPLEAKVVEVVKGGLTIAIHGLRGFVPASRVALKYVEDLSEFVGQTIKVIPIEIDREKNRAVFSRRQVLEKEQLAQEEQIYAALQEGQKIKGKVSRLTGFGAFVDIGGVDGLVHISDLSWKRVKSPEEVVQVGDEIEVLVQKVDKDARRISLSLKAVERDPWFDAVTPFKEGSSVEGKVTKTTKFGAFVEIAKGVEGLVHLSELAERRVGSAEEIVTPGQNVTVKILSIDTKAKKIALSLVQAQQDAQRAEYQNYLAGQQSFGITIGDKLGHLFKSED